VADILPLHSPVAAPPTDPVGSPLVVDARRLAAMLCAGIRTVRTWNAAGKLPAPVRIGGRVVWRVDEIRAWLAAGAPSRNEWEARRAARK
jgi:predicted DNA-binding transcriptional regulator AlpA